MHKCAAIMFAAALAYPRDRLTAKAWQGNKHHAAKCIETSQDALCDPLYRQSNVQIEVEINFH